MSEARPLTTADIAGSGRPDPEGEAVESEQEALLPKADSERLAARWQDVQGAFVDRPRQAVEEADRLVADLMQRIATEFSDTRTRLEQQWDGQEDVSTEDLRLALQRYRSFFQRLLAA
jgi:hypothetical protein